MGSDQSVGQIGDEVAIVPHRALLTVQRRGVSNGDVIVVQGVVVRHFPIALQAEAAAGLLLQWRLPVVASLLMDQLQLLGQGGGRLGQRHPDQWSVLLNWQRFKGPISSAQGSNKTVFPGSR